jgi:Tfp pilus assembly protein PilX
MKAKKLKKIKEQRGIALLTSILLLGALGVLGFTAVNVSNVDTKITRNTKTSKQAFYLAEAGAEAAREKLRYNLAVSHQTLTSQLSSVKGPDGVLTDSSNTGNYSSSDDVPFITASLGSGSFKVYLSNDPLESVTNTTDSNGIVTLTAFGYGPDNAVAVIQTTVQKGGGMPLPNLPGAITLAGPNVVFDAPDSNAFVVTGDTTHPAIAVNSSTSYNTITTNKTVIKRADQYTGAGGTPSVQNLTFQDPWGNLTDLDKVYTNLKNAADFTSPSDSGFTLGSSSDRKVVVIDGDYTINAATGAGILLVTGKLTLHGAFNYDGIILAIGQGSMLRNGAGNGIITGGIYVANIRGADHQLDTPDDTFATVTFDTTGGGTSTIEYNATDQNASDDLLNRIPFVRRSWKQINS